MPAISKSICWDRQIKQAKQDRDELDGQLPRGGGPLVARLQTAEKELARLEELLPLESQRDSAEREAADVPGSKNKRCANEYRRLRNNWRQLLSAAGLPVDLAPATIARILPSPRTNAGIEQGD